MATNIVFTKTLAAASVNNIAQSQVGAAGTPLTLNGSAVVNGVAIIDTYNAATNSAPGRRVLITSSSGVETATFVLTGTNQSGNTISETITFSGSSTTASSNLDYVTVTKVLPTTTVVGTIQVGTNTAGSSPWVTWNFLGCSPFNLGVAIDVATGAATYTFDYTYDDPNNLAPGVTAPLVFNVAALAGATTGSPKDGLLSTPIMATRLSISTGTGTVRVRVIQAGIG